MARNSRGGVMAMLKLTMTLSIVFIIITILSGCSVVSTAMEYRDTYCDKTQDSFTKAVALAGIKSFVAGYPEGGICEGYESTWYGAGFYGK